MQWNNHYKLEGQHAFLGASKWNWINYDADKLISSYESYLAVQRGTILHDFARRCIELNQRLPKSTKTLNTYVNDAIGFKMSPEVVLYYSDNCFGTTDAIAFRDNFLRIHDLKTGTTPAHMEQLEIYAALFCLEYHVSPKDIQIELRLYQNSDVIVLVPEPDDIIDICKKIKEFDEELNSYKKGKEL